MKLVVLPAVKLVGECLVHIGDILLVPTTLGQDSCCVWYSKLSLGSAPCALRVLVCVMVTQTNKQANSCRCKFALYEGIWI
jgi:hypothetical protein